MQKQLFGINTEAFYRCSEQLAIAQKEVWNSEQCPELAQLLAVNEESLDICAAACRRERMYSPLISPGGGILLNAPDPLESSVHHVHELLAARGSRHVGAGRIDEALADSERIHRLSRLISQKPTIMSQLMANRAAAEAAGLDAVVIQSQRLTAEQARRQTHLIRSLPPFVEFADVVDRFERFSKLESVTTMVGSIRVRRRLDVNLMLRVVNTSMDELVAAMRQPAPAERQAAVQEYIQRTGSESDQTLNLWVLLVSGRAAASTMTARMVLGIDASSGEQFVRSELLRSVRQEMVLAGYALAEYHAIHGQFPETMEELVPVHLAEAPLDPFGSSPVRYRADNVRGTILLYSVGENGIDDSGRFLGSKADDIAFGTVPRPDEPPESSSE